MKLENPNAPAGALTLDHFWMPFTANRQFKATPRLLARAKDMYYWTPDGRQVLDGTAGLWCVNAGHCREPIVRAVQEQAATMDFAPTFQMGHPLIFEAATAVAKIAAARHGPLVLHQLGLGSGRKRAQDRARLSPRQGRADAAHDHRPRARLPRHQFRRHAGRRHSGQPQALRRHDVELRSPALDRTISTATPTPRACRSTAASSPWSSSA